MTQPEGCNSFPLPFTMDEYNQRFENVYQQMREKNVSVFLITELENMHYLTNFQTLGNPLQALILSLDQAPYFVTRKLEEANAIRRTHLPYQRIFSYTDFQNSMDYLMNLLHGMHPDLHNKNIGLECSSSRCSISLYNRMCEEFPDCQVVDMYTTCGYLRLVKSEAELKIMKETAPITMSGVLAGIKSVQVGVSEDEIAANMYYTMFRNGTEYSGYPIFVTSGTKISLTHSTNLHKQIEDNELVFLEVAGVRERYATAIMRTCYVGKEIPDYVKQGEELILQAISEAMEMMKPGTKCSDIDRRIREIISNNDHGFTQYSRSAYSIGVNFQTDWGEGEYLSFALSEDRVLQKNMTFHLIPWIQIPNRGGIGISETVLVTDEGGVSFFDLPRGIIHVVPPEKLPTFASDNVPGCSTDMMSSVLAANEVDQLAYGNDDFKACADSVMQEHFGDKHFEYVMNGTSANVLSMACLTRSFHGIICSDISHLYRDECGAVEKISGSRLIPLPSINGKISLDEIKHCMADQDIVHRVQPKVISLTQPTEMGTLYSLEEIQRIADFAHDNNMYLHIDGARLSNACVAMKCSLADMTKHADVTSLGGTKNGMLFGDAVIIDKGHADELKYYTKQHLNLLSKNRFITTQFIEMFKSDEWYRNAAHANNMAQLLEEKIKDLVKVTRPVETNAVFIELGDVTEQLSKRYQFVKWNNQEVRLMCSFKTQLKDIEQLADFLRSV